MLFDELSDRCRSMFDDYGVSVAHMDDLVSYASAATSPSDDSECAVSCLWSPSVDRGRIVIASLIAELRSGSDSLPCVVGVGADALKGVDEYSYWPSSMTVGEFICSFAADVLPHCGTLSLASTTTVVNGLRSRVDSDAEHVSAAMRVCDACATVGVKAYGSSIMPLVKAIEGHEDSVERALVELGMISRDIMVALMACRLSVMCPLPDADNQTDVVIVPEAHDINPAELFIILMLARQQAWFVLFLCDPQRSVLGFRGSCAQLWGDVVDGVASGRVGLCQDDLACAQLVEAAGRWRRTFHRSLPPVQACGRLGSDDALTVVTPESTYHSASLSVGEVLSDRAAGSEDTVADRVESWITGLVAAGESVTVVADGYPLATQWSEYLSERLDQPVAVFNSSINSVSHVLSSVTATYKESLASLSPLDVPDELRRLAANAYPDESYLVDHAVRYWWVHVSDSYRRWVDDLSEGSLTLDDYFDKVMKSVVIAENYYRRSIHSSERESGSWDSNPPVSVTTVTRCRSQSFENVLYLSRPPYVSREFYSDKERQRRLCVLTRARSRFFVIDTASGFDAMREHLAIGQ